MSVAIFEKEKKALEHARLHFETDPGTRVIYYLPEMAPDREIRLLEVNDSIAERDRDPFEPLEFGVDTGRAEAHALTVLDVTPAQWEKIDRHELGLPQGWSLEKKVPFTR